MNIKTIMERETGEAPSIIAKQFIENKDIIRQLVQKLQSRQPKFVVTIGRGSSDHACTYAKYLFETKFGLVTSSAAPSVISIYHAELNFNNSLVIAISQSGQSPDVCEVMRAARKKGAMTIAIVNTADSPLAEIAETVVPMLAGQEQAVAATKSYLASLAIILQLVAYWSQDSKLLYCLDQLPERLEQALTMDWNAAILAFKDIMDLLVLARGYGFPIAQEAALKLKETCTIQAEAFSAAEVLHGPFALIKSHPYLLFSQNDPTMEGMFALGEKIKKLGGKPLLAIAPSLIKQKEISLCAENVLSLPEPLHPMCDPLMVIQAFYMMAARLAVARGYDPDKPQNLQKITETR